MQEIDQKEITIGVFPSARVFVSNCLLLERETLTDGICAKEKTWIKRRPNRTDINFFICKNDKCQSVTL